MYNLLKQDNTSSSAGNFAYGFVAGGLIVGTLALLFAPKSGKKLRKQIHSTLNNSSEELLSSAGGYLSTAKEKANSLLTDGKDTVANLFGKADAELKAMESKTTELISEAKHKLGSVLDIDSQVKKTQSYKNKKHH